MMLLLTNINSYYYSLIIIKTNKTMYNSIDYMVGIYYIIKIVFYYFIWKYNYNLNILII